MRTVRSVGVGARGFAPRATTKCYGTPPVCLTSSDCDPLDPKCVPTTISRSAVGHTAYHHTGMGHTAYHHVGGVADVLWSPTARYLGIAAAAFHGYRRNKSIGWAILWALLGGASPPITLGVALAQGYGKPKSKSKGA